VVLSPRELAKVLPRPQVAKRECLILTGPPSSRRSWDGVDDVEGTLVLADAPKELTRHHVPYGDRAATTLAGDDLLSPAEERERPAALVVLAELGDLLPRRRW